MVMVGVALCGVRDALFICMQSGGRGGQWLVLLLESALESSKDVILMLSFFFLINFLEKFSNE
jgi:hypothetical protein